MVAVTIGAAMARATATTNRMMERVETLRSAIQELCAISVSLVNVAMRQKAQILQLELENESLRAQLYADEPAPRADRRRTGWELD